MISPMFRATRAHAFGVALAALASGAAGAAAQQISPVTQRSYALVERRLTIDVRIDSPGSLRVVRGGLGRVDVIGQGRGDALAVSALDGHHRNVLTLTALGDAPVRYLVTVPERVDVRVRLPDRPLPEHVRSRGAADFEWGDATSGPAAAPAPITIELPAGTRDFTLRRDGRTILELRDGVVTAPRRYTDVRLPDGGRAITFTPPGLQRR